MKSDAENDIYPRKYCLEKNVLGVGWEFGMFNQLNMDDYDDLGEKNTMKLAIEVGGPQSTRFFIE